MSWNHPLDILVNWQNAIPRPDPLAMMHGEASPELIAELEALAGQVPAAAPCDRPLTDAWRVLWAFGEWVREQWKDADRPPLDCLVLAALWTQAELQRLGGQGVHQALTRLDQSVPPSLVVAARDFLGTARAATQYAELRLEVAVTTRTGHAERVQLWTVADGLTEDLALARRGQPYDAALFLSAAQAAAFWRAGG